MTSLDSKSSIDGQAQWTKAPVLKSGAVIAFVAPAGPVNVDLMLKAKQRFEGMGFRVLVPDGIDRKDGYLAGSDAQRAAEFNAAIANKDVNAVFAVRGGCGIMRILTLIDYQAIEKNPKIIAGFSDVTALHLAIAKKCRLVTFHSPMPQCSLFNEDDDGYRYSSQQFWRWIWADKYTDVDNTIWLPKDRPPPVSLAPGKARGRLVGGNLSLICATIGTAYQIESKDNILFIEDTNEKAYRIDRFLCQLKLAGLLAEFVGVVIGTFDGVDEKELQHVFADYFGKSTVPVITNYPVGHTQYNATFAHGALVELNADTLSICFLELPVNLKLGQ